MAIKIDLLPSYVKLEKRFRNVLIACIGLLLLWFGGLAMALQVRQLQLQTTQTDLAVFQERASLTQTAQQDVATLVGQRQGLDSAVNVFVSNSKVAPSARRCSTIFSNISIAIHRSLWSM